MTPLTPVVNKPMVVKVNGKVLEKKEEEVFLPASTEGKAWRAYSMMIPILLAGVTYNNQMPRMLSTNEEIDRMFDFLYHYIDLFETFLEKLMNLVWIALGLAVAVYCVVMAVGIIKYFYRR